MAFPREENKGIVVMLERRPGNNKNEKDGSNGGVIQVKSGPLHGKLVYFSRRILFINGFNMSKCDLTRIINRGFNVTVECIPQRDANNTKTTYNDQPVPYMATLVWGGRTAKGRPKNLEAKPGVSTDGGQGQKWKQFLQEKSMTRKEFLQFVAGEGPVIPKSVFLTAKNGIFHEREMKEAIKKNGIDDKGSRGAENGTSTKSKEEDTKSLLVYRHGLSAAELCDRALDVTGPNDSRIPQLISSDADAQMAFHLQKTFAAALENYKTKKDLRVTQVWSQPIAGSNLPNMAILNGFQGASPFASSFNTSSTFGNSSFNGGTSSYSNGSSGGYNSQKYNKKSYSNGGSGQRTDWGNRSGDKRKSDGGGNNEGSGRKRRRRRN